MGMKPLWNFHRLLYAMLGLKHADALCVPVRIGRDHSRALCNVLRPEALRLRLQGQWQVSLSMWRMCQVSCNSFHRSQL